MTVVCRALLVLLMVLLFQSTATADQGVYQTSEAFLTETFGESIPKPKVLWLKGELKEECKNILGHPYSRLRVKYWQQGARSAWVLDEIGKEKPITVGLVIDQAEVEKIKVLAFRESRGWEIKHPFFTRQFDGVSLTEKQQLDKNIDGVSGATLSVRALKKLARMALHLNRHVQHSR